MEQWLKRTGKQQCKNANVAQNETTTMGPNSHMSPSRQKKLKKNAAARSFNPYGSAESSRRKEALKETQNSRSRAILMTQIEQLKKRVDFNTRNASKILPTIKSPTTQLAWMPRRGPPLQRRSLTQ
jgi:hypothetical protein